MRDFDLRALQEKELECLKEIDRICRKHQIKYFLSWGSAIGAIRHKGFIPWDDDIDITMLQEDYIKFKTIAQREMNQAYFFQDWESDPYYYSSWAKIRCNDTTSMMRNMMDYPIHFGVCIDIFPLLPYPSESMTRFDLFLSKLVTFFSSKRLNDYGYGHIFYENKKLKYFPRFFCDWLRNSSYRLLTRKRKQACPYVLTNGNRTFDLAFPKEYFEEVIEVDFEDGKFLINQQYDAFLSAYYGDYMKIPEVHERVDHGDMIVDLENSYLKYQVKRKEAKK